LIHREIREHSMKKVNLKTQAEAVISVTVSTVHMRKIPEWKSLRMDLGCPVI
jgi:hypothetical protein